MLLRQQKASSNFSIYTPSNIPGVLYCLVLPLDYNKLVKMLFLGGIFS